MKYRRSPGRLDSRGASSASNASPAPVFDSREVTPVGVGVGVGVDGVDCVTPLNKDDPQHHSHSSLTAIGKVTAV